jgi:DNA-3-methyladenine glycosylase
MAEAAGTERRSDIARGPGRLARAIRVTLAHDGMDLCGPGALFLAVPAQPAGPIVTATRIGITKDAHRPLRFFERGNPHVSGPKRLISG